MARGDGDWLDKTTLLVAALGLLAASCAAIFAWQSASTARDTEERQLRAYLVLSDFFVVCAECGDTPEPGYPREYTHGRILNSGETPAYQVRGVTSWIGYSGTEKSDRLMPADFDFRDHQPTGLVSATDIGRDQHKDVSGEIGADEVPTFRMAAQGGSTLYTGTSIIAMSSESRTAPPTASSTSPGPVSRSPSATDTTARFRHTHTCAH